MLRITLRISGRIQKLPQMGIQTGKIWICATEIACDNLSKVALSFQWFLHGQAYTWATDKTVMSCKMSIKKQVKPKHKRTKAQVCWPSTSTDMALSCPGIRGKRPCCDVDVSARNRKFFETIKKFSSMLVKTSKYRMESFWCLKMFGLEIKGRTDITISGFYTILHKRFCGWNLIR